MVTISINIWASSVSPLLSEGNHLSRTKAIALWLLYHKELLGSGGYLPSGDEGSAPGEWCWRWGRNVAFYDIFSQTVQIKYCYLNNLMRWWWISLLVKWLESHGGLGGPCLPLLLAFSGKVRVRFEAALGPACPAVMVRVELCPGCGHWSRRALSRLCPSK